MPNLYWFTVISCNQSMKARNMLKNLLFFHESPSELLPSWDVLK